MVEQVVLTPSVASVSTAYAFATMPATDRHAFASDAIMTRSDFYTTEALALMGVNGATWCWSSPRGYVADFQTSLGGVCAAGANDTCFVHFKNGMAWSGCADVDDLMEEIADYTQVNMTNGYISWGQAANGTEPMACYTSNDNQVCTVPATSPRSMVPRNVLANANLAPYATTTSTVVSTPISVGTVWEATAAACGCEIDYYNAHGAEWPSNVCRSNSANASCYVTYTGCDTLDFNCGTYYGWMRNQTSSQSLATSTSSYLRLCTGCALTEEFSSRTVGQCQKDGGMCAGVDDGGDCPGPYALCDAVYATGTPPAYADLVEGVFSGTDTFRSSVARIGAATAFLWKADGRVYDLFGVWYDPGQLEVGPTAVLTQRLARWIPDVFGFQDLATRSGGTGAPQRVATTYDPVNCLPAFARVDSTYLMSTVESPTYLSTRATTGVFFPTSITEAGLEAWCASSPGGICDAARKWWCVDLGQTLVQTTTSSLCVLRRQWASMYTQYTTTSGTTAGSFSKATAKVFPNCYAWVSGIDADTDCQDPRRFTGCVLTETTRHWASSVDASMSKGFVDTGAEVWHGARFNGTGTDLCDTTDCTAVSAVTCRSVCVSHARCSTWALEGGVCTVYSDVTWPRRTDGSNAALIQGGVNDSVGLWSGGASFGMPVPRVHMGPTVSSMAPSQLGRLYSVTGADFFVLGVSNASHEAATAPFGAFTCNGTSLSHPAGVNAAVTPCTFPAGSQLVYHGPDAENDVVSAIDLTTGVMLTRAQIAEYTQFRHTFAVTPQMMRVDVSASVLGVLEEEFDIGFESTVFSDDNVTTGHNIGRGRGLRGVFQGPAQTSLKAWVYSVEHQSARLVTLVLARWRYDPTVSTAVVLGPVAARNARRTCVPITLRQPVKKSTFADLATSLEIVRRDPVDCLVAGTVAGDANVKRLFVTPGKCSGSQGMQWPSGVPNAAVGLNDDAAYVSTMRYFSQWFTILSGSTVTNAAIFYDPSQNAPSAINGVDLADVVSYTNLATPALAALYSQAYPNCQANGGSVDNCEVAVDVFGVIPCTGAFQTTSSTCSKPTMNAMCPLYEPSESVTPNTPFLYPDDLYVGTPTVSDLTNTSSWSAYSWSRYFPMVHYCDRYVGTGSVPENGWKPGKFVHCDNDPLDAAGRLSYCTDKQPWWVVTGRVVNELTFADLCPFTAYDTGDQYCYVFADGEYPTVGAFMNARLPGTLSWASTTFYYIPFRFGILKRLLVDIRVVNTLLTNTILDGETILLDSTNYDQYGPTASLIAEHLLTLIGNNATKLALVNTLCSGTDVNSRAIRIVPEVFEILNEVVQGYRTTTGTYIMPAASDSTTTNQETLTEDQVLGTFNELSTPIEYDNIRITTIGGSRAHIGNDPAQIINRVEICTRFQVNARNVLIENVVLNQSLCPYTGVFSRTPIMASGQYVTLSQFSNLTVVDASAAVSAFGGDSLVFRATETLDVDGMLIYNITFLYTDGTNGLTTEVPIDRQRMLAVFSRTKGVATVMDCSPAGLPSPSPAGRYEHTLNCGLEFLPAADVAPCGLPQMCATESGCCGNDNVITHIPDPSCAFGLLCVGNNTHLEAVIQEQPNSRLLCSADQCACSVGDDCTTVINKDTCYYVRDTCRIVCTEGQYMNISASGVATDASGTLVIQDWQYGPGADTVLGLGGWYAIQGSYPSTLDGGDVSFVRAVGHGQYVWTVRRPVPCASLSSIRLPSELSVEARLLPVRGGTVPFDTITVVPDFATGTSTRVYASSVRLVLMTDWFFAVENASLYDPGFLTALRSTSWCVSRTNGQIGVARCDSTTSEVEWFYDSVQTRLHLSGEPYLCPTFLSDRPMTACNETRFGSAQVSSENRQHATTSSVPLPNQIDGGPLVFIPCLPCAIGAERALVPDEAPTSIQLFKNTGTGPVDAVYGVAAPIGAVSAVASQPGTSWYAYLLNHAGQCATVALNGTAYWSACDTSFMLPSLTTPCSGLTAGVFRYVCGKEGGPIRAVKNIGGPCTLAVNGQITTPQGEGAVLRQTNEGLFEVVNPGHGYIDSTTVTSGTCVLIISVPKVFIKPYDAAEDVAGNAWQLINVTRLLGYIGRIPVFPTDDVSVNSSPVVIVIDIILIVINVVCFLLHIALPRYKANILANTLDKTEKKTI